MTHAMNATKKNNKNKTSGIFGRIFGKTFKKLGWMKKKEDSPNTKIKKELDKLKSPTTNVASEIKEHKDILEKLEKDIQKDIKQETQNAEVLERVTEKVNALKDEEKKKISNLKQQEAKIKAEKSKMRLLHKLKKPITTEKKDLRTLAKLPPTPIEKYPVTSSHEIPSINTEYLEKDSEDIKIPIAYIRHHTLKRSNHRGGKKHGKSKKYGKK